MRKVLKSRTEMAWVLRRYKAAGRDVISTSRDSRRMWLSFHTVHLRQSFFQKWKEDNCGERTPERDRTTNQENIGLGNHSLEAEFGS